MHRPRIAVATAFTIMCLIGLAAIVAAENSLNERPADDAGSAPPPAN